MLPFTSGAAIDDALTARSDAVAATAAVLLWATWAVGLVALLAPRPVSTTVLRVAAPVAVVATVASMPDASPLAAWGGLASALVAASVALSAPVAHAAADGAAYGDESRFPLRAPFSLLVGLLPLAVVLVATGVASGPLLLAAGRPVAGGVALVVGLPVAALAARSLESLARRWVVVVPAGIVLADPLALADPVLVRTAQLAAIRRADVDPGDALDLRLGTAFGSVALELRSPLAFGRRTGRGTVTVVEADVVLVTPLRPGRLVAAAPRARKGGRAR